MANSATHKYTGALAFRPARPLADSATLIAFGRDLYVESLGSDAGFRRDYGARGQKFPLWIAACSASRADFATLLTENDKPIGFVVLGRNSRDRNLGHVASFLYAAISPRAGLWRSAR